MGSSESVPSVTLYSQDSTAYFGYEETKDSESINLRSVLINWTLEQRNKHSSDDESDEEDEEEKEKPNKRPKTDLLARNQSSPDEIKYFLDKHKIDGLWLNHINLETFEQWGPFSLKYLSLGNVKEDTRKILLNPQNLEVLKLNDCALWCAHDTIWKWIPKQLISFTWGLSAIEYGYFLSADSLTWDPNTMDLAMDILLSIDKLDLSDRVLSFFWKSSRFSQLLDKNKFHTTEIFPNHIRYRKLKDQQDVTAQFIFMGALSKSNQYISLDMDVDIDLIFYDYIVNHSEFQNRELRVKNIKKHTPLLKNVGILHFWDIDDHLFDWLHASMSSQDWNIKEITQGGFKKFSVEQVAALKLIAKNTKIPCYW
jgi:hypothetical protein